MSVSRRLSELKAAIESACRRAGRDPSSVRLLAVSKRQPARLIEEAYVAGQRDFGENYVQELCEKRRELAHLEGIRWHLIGHLQTNKVRQVVDAAAVFHALDSERLVREIAKRATRPWPVFIEVNVDDEASKSGVAPGDVAALATLVRATPQLELRGLMCIPAATGEPEQARPAFRRLAGLARSLEGGGRPLELSMGMSSDFEVAVEEGSNWVRIGTSLFGVRQS